MKRLLSIQTCMALLCIASLGACCTQNSTNGPCAASCCTSCCDGCGCYSCDSCSSCCSSTCYKTYGQTWFSQKDQGSNEYLIMSFTADKRHQFDREDFYGDFALTLGWQQNYSPYKLSSYFMNNTGTMTVGANNQANVRASDLGLSTTFSGTAWLCPSYADFIADFDLYVAWDEFAQGLWTDVHVPFVHTRWNSGLGSRTQAPGGTCYTANTTQTGITTHYVVSETTQTPIEVVYGGGCALSSALLGNCAFGDAPRLSAGKIINCVRTTNGLGDVRFDLGYDFIRQARGSVGVGLAVAFPAANKLPENNCCHDLYIFDPSIGSQHAWKVGGLLRGQCLLWEREDKDRLDIYADAHIYGVFGGKTTRLLGLNAGNGRCCNTLFNHYLLLKKYSSEGDTVKYEGLERAANLLKARVKYCNAIPEGQVTAMLQYKRRGFVCAAGYNFFGRGAEKLGICGFCTPAAPYYYVIKGPAPVKTVIPGGDLDGGFYSAADSNIGKTGALVPGSDASFNQIPLPLMKANAINFDPGCSNVSVTPACHPTYISNTLFINLGYNWEDTDWKPYVGLLAKADIGQNNTALSLWGAYIKGGICF